MLEGYNYVPLLHTKNIELTALSKLDNFTKARLFPILICRPGGHNDFGDTVASVKLASTDLRVAVGLDRSRFGKSKKVPAKDQYDALFNPHDGFRNFFDFIGQWEAALPVLMTVDGRYEQIEQQLKHSTSLDRGFLVRIRQDEARHFTELLNAGIFDGGERSFVVDAEWSLDILKSENWLSYLIAAISDRLPNAEIVCLSSSFPKSFTNIGARGVFSNDDRELFDRVRRANNQANLIFGDWGSTRSSEETFSNKPRPRVDVATTNEWISFRLGDNEQGGYESVARRAEKDRIWLETPDCWGKRIIELTAIERPQMIKSSYAANCCRINIHLTIQAMGDQILPLPEEPFNDNF